MVHILSVVVVRLTFSSFKIHNPGSDNYCIELFHPALHVTKKIHTCITY